MNLNGGLMDLKFSVIVEDLEWICCFSDGNSTFNIGSEVLVGAEDDSDISCVYVLTNCCSV